MCSGSKYYSEEVDEDDRAKYRTECWLERCLSDDRICSPDDHISFTPLKVAIPVPGKLARAHLSVMLRLLEYRPGAQTIDLSLSGLEESEALWVGRLARALGNA